MFWILLLIFKLSSTISALVAIRLLVKFATATEHRSFTAMGYIVLLGTANFLFMYLLFLD